MTDEWEWLIYLCKTDDEMHCLLVVKSDRHPFLCVSIESYKRFFKSENKFSRERKMRNKRLVYLPIQ